MNTDRPAYGPCSCDDCPVPAGLYCAGQFHPPYCSRRDHVQFQTLAVPLPPADPDPARSRPDRPGDRPGLLSTRLGPGGADARDLSATAPAGHWGPPLWAALHRRPLTYTGDQAAELAWLADLSRRLVGCDCRTDWVGRLKLDPPDLSSPESYAQWGWARHNEVNQKLKKPVLSWTDAANLWGWPGTDDPS